MTVYIITDGDHAMADWHIYAVVSTPERAAELAAESGGRVCQWEVDGVATVPTRWCRWDWLAVAAIAAAVVVGLCSR